jgi:hypothetical protein
MIEIYKHATQSMARAERGSADWLYWRGILLGLEVARKPPGTITTEWLDTVLQCNALPAETNIGGLT